MDGETSNGTRACRARGGRWSGRTTSSSAASATPDRGWTLSMSSSRSACRSTRFDRDCGWAYRSHSGIIRQAVLVGEILCPPAQLGDSQLEQLLCVAATILVPLGLVEPLDVIDQQVDVVHPGPVAESSPSRCRLLRAEQGSGRRERLDQTDRSSPACTGQGRNRVAQDLRRWCLPEAPG